MDQETITAIEEALDALIKNHPAPELTLPAECQGIALRLFALRSMLEQLQQFALEISNGNVDAEPPPRSNYLAASLKQLQAQMRHLTWQAQCVSRGDYSQKIDFMGEFSEAFNIMVNQLQERDSFLTSRQDVLLRLFDKVEPVIVVEAGNRDNILYTNRMAQQRFAAAPLPGQPTALDAILGVPPDATEYQVLDPVSNRWYSVTSGELHWDQHTMALLYYCLDITAHKERETSLEQEANTDPLTGISNRRAFEQLMASAWGMCRDYQLPLSILMLDIDHFKAFNDRYGHIQGDRCLEQVAGVLRGRIARSDDVVARYGGEEFVALLPRTSRENALQVAEAVRLGIQEMDIPLEDGETAKTTISIGVSSLVPTDEHSVWQLLGAADAALYEAKHSSRNMVCYREVITADATR